MFDFEISKAVSLTVGGAGTAFVALGTLVALTKLMARLLSPAAESEFAESVDQAGALSEVPPDRLGRADAAAEGPRANKPKLVAAATAAVAMTMACEEDEYETMLGEAVDRSSQGSGVVGWKSQGIWEIMSSRMAAQSRRAMRRGP